MSNVATLTDPTWVTRDSSNALGNTAMDARLGMAGLADPSTSSTYGFATGVFPGSASGSTILDCQVVQAASANMTVQVQPGNYQVGRANLGAYLGAVTGNTTVTVSGSNGSNPRVDYVILRVREPTVDGTVTATAQLLVLPGAPAATPSESAAAAQMTDGDLLLAAVTVRAGTTSVLQADISDRRVYAKARGGIGVKSASDASNGSYPGDRRWNLATANDEVWTGSGWIPLASPSAWTAFTPRLLCSGTGTDIGLGSSSTRLGRYIQLGKVLHFNYYFRWGAQPWNGGYGRVYTLLPTGMTAPTYSQWVQAHLWVNNQGLSADYKGQAGIGGFFGQTQLQPVFTKGGGADDDGYYTISGQATNGAGTGYPKIAGSYPEGGELTISGSIECL